MDPEKKETEQILNSLDGLQRATANPFLYDKIRTRLGSRGRPEMDRTILRWAIALAFVAVLNVATWTLIRVDNRPANALNAVAGQLGFSNSSYQY